MRLTRYDLLLAGTSILAVLVALVFYGWMRWLWLSLLFSTTGLVVGLGVSFPEWQLFGRSFCRGQTESKVAALTFDDGPDPATTPALLDLLARRRVQATFFCTGKQVTAHREIARRIASEHHLIGNHSCEHSPWINFFGERRLRQDLERAQTIITDATGQIPKFYRPPMTLTNPCTFRVTRALSLITTGCSVRSYDLRKSSLEAVLERVQRGLRPGAIVLLHDGGVAVERLLPLVEMLIDQLNARGYRCVRLDELAVDGDQS
jgi:peptidoglycan-N-acetylglucosamine deacetylase